MKFAQNDCNRFKQNKKMSINLMTSGNRENRKSDEPILRVCIVPQVIYTFQLFLK